MASSRRKSVVGLMALCITSAILFITVHHHHYSGRELEILTNVRAGTSVANVNWADTASNATLGFGSIEYLTLPYEYDRTATLIMQAQVAGLKMTQNDAISTNDIHPKLKGVPPSSRVAILGPEEDHSLGVKACALSHMKLWEKLLLSDQQTMFIMEADAMWGKNLRQESRTIAEGMHQLQEQLENQTLADPSPNDPFNSADWDILSYGSCKDNQNFRQRYTVVNDTEAMDAEYFDLESLHEQRVIRQSGSMICTTAYAISRRGAMKMLLRSSLSFDKEVDVLTEYMIARGKLKAFSPYPMPIVQWRYKKGLGADSLASNIETLDDEGLPPDVRERWIDVMNKESVWESQWGFMDIKNSALDEVKNYIQNM